jgi:hypothetical protein
VIASSNSMNSWLNYVRLLDKQMVRLISMARLVSAMRILNVWTQGLAWSRMLLEKSLEPLLTSNLVDWS